MYDLSVRKQRCQLFKKDISCYLSKALVNTKKKQGQNYTYFLFKWTLRSAQESVQDW